MGTRSTIVVIDKEGEVKVSQYGQFDGGPSELGVNLLALLKKENFLSQLESSLSKLVFIREYQQGKEKFGKWYDTFFCRNLKEKVLENIVSCEDETIELCKEDLDNLWIRYRYTISYQTNTFYVECQNKKGVSVKTFELYNLPNKDIFLNSLPKE